MSDPKWYGAKNICPTCCKRQCICVAMEKLVVKYKYSYLSLATSPTDWEYPIFGPLPDGVYPELPEPDIIIEDTK